MIGGTFLLLGVATLIQISLADIMIPHSDTELGECKDLHDKCHLLHCPRPEIYRYRIRNHVYMDEMCKKSCGLCPTLDNLCKMTFMDAHCYLCMANYTREHHVGVMKKHALSSFEEMGHAYCHMLADYSSKRPRACTFGGEDKYRCLEWFSKKSYGYDHHGETPAHHCRNCCQDIGFRGDPGRCWREAKAGNCWRENVNLYCHKTCNGSGCRNFK